jgi:hypothetical protein
LSYPKPVGGGADEDHCPRVVRLPALGERRILLVGHRRGDAVELVDRLPAARLVGRRTSTNPQARTTISWL